MPPGGQQLRNMANLAADRDELARRTMCKETGMSEDSHLALARASYAAYIAKDRAALETLIADDFHFTSPLDNHLSRRTYFERCWPNSEWLEAFDFIHLVPDGDRVFVTYEARAVDGRRFRNTEILTFRGGQIIDVEVYFGWSIPHEATAGGFVDKP